MLPPFLGDSTVSLCSLILPLVKQSLSKAIRTHEASMVITSLYLSPKVDLQPVTKASRWSSGRTFSSFYLRDPCLQANCLYKAGPLGKVVVVTTTYHLFGMLMTFPLGFWWILLVPTPFFGKGDDLGPLELYLFLSESLFSRCTFQI